MLRRPASAIASPTAAAIGAWLAGVLVEQAGAGAALACAPLAAALGLLAALAGRRALTV